MLTSPSTALPPHSSSLLLWNQGTWIFLPPEYYYHLIISVSLTLCILLCTIMAQSEVYRQFALQQALRYKEEMPERAWPEAALLLLVRLHAPLLDLGPDQDDPPGHLLYLDRATRLLQHLDVFLHAGKHRQSFIVEFCFTCWNEVWFLGEVLG